MKAHSARFVALALVIIFVTGCTSASSVQTPATAVPPAQSPPTTAPTLVPPTAVPTSTLAAPASPPAAAMGKVTTEAGEITSEALEGNLLGDPNTRQFYVMLPPGYASSGKRYPVVYVLHGYASLPTHMVGPFKRAYENALRAGEVQEMIFAFPDANNVLGGSTYDSSITIGDYETYLAQEFVEHIDATYRTLPDRRSRGITGCSMGGDGSFHLALTHPGVFSVAAPISGAYDSSDSPYFDMAAGLITELPEDFADLSRLRWEAKLFLAAAAASAPNPDKPPFYFDMPFVIVDGQSQLVPEVLDKMIATDVRFDLDGYLAQPDRLNAILISHGADDQLNPVEPVRKFDQHLTDLGVDHEYLEVDGGHCDFPFDPVVKFLSDNLLSEE